MKKTNLVTPGGWNKLDQELKYLWKEKRPQVTRAVSEAAALGDRSENAEYKEGKRELRSIDRRLRFLMKRLEELEIVHYAPSQEGKVYFGAYVELENDNEEQATYRVVGPDEIDVENNHITIDSPMARALIGKEIDDEVVVKTPSGDKIWYINNIFYKK
ncbi:transcription elongation factor GreB [Psychrobium sp. MM17-31]|uniref:transcription elongation factor GreB n=1 Tax=Psychrobium sp. MM17-31 TaxID=2917758 RepID=UPI001EF65008|nr:transcription elongation factor GreB [Psychrobium sp. MM17-31]MCG7533051.1 transcription elongation factor GreB [Psychrobium sp. MM17-31]